MLEGDAMDDLASFGTAVADVALDVPPPAEPAIVSITFTRHTVGRLITLVRSACVRAGVAPRDIEDLLIAISEIATNAIQYAGGGGTFTLRHRAGGLLAEIRDDGPGLPDGLAVGHPSRSAPDGRGLWLARLLCKDFDVVSTPRGVTVRMYTPCAVTV
jgi:anti-sigma regulatory factor (Ser/Thr protein kinase)